MTKIKKMSKNEQKRHSCRPERSEGSLGCTRDNNYNIYIVMFIVLSFLFISTARAAEEIANEASAGGIAGAFGIDWMKFVAQLINFAIVLFILWKWVFTPVTKKLEERTAKIEKSLNDADRITKEKQDFEDWRNQEISKVRQEAGAVISQAQIDSNKVKDEVLAQTKQEQEKLVIQAKKQIEEQKAESLRAAKTELADLVVSATEKIIGEKLTSEKDQRLIKESLGSLK